jgi:hypothetical protein
VIDIEREI